LPLPPIGIDTWIALIANDGEQILRAKWLAQIVVRPDQAGFEAIQQSIAAREDHHQRVSAGWLELELLENLIPIHPRNVQVQQEKIKRQHLLYAVQPSVFPFQRVRRAC
jgi:hypothetical protein